MLKSWAAAWTGVWTAGIAAQRAAAWAPYLLRLPGRACWLVLASSHRWHPEGFMVNVGRGVGWKVFQSWGRLVGLSRWWCRQRTRGAEGLPQRLRRVVSDNQEARAATHVLL